MTNELQTQNPSTLEARDYSERALAEIERENELNHSNQIAPEHNVLLEAAIKEVERQKIAETRTQRARAAAINALGSAARRHRERYLSQKKWAIERLFASEERFNAILAACVAVAILFGIGLWVYSSREDSMMVASAPPVSESAALPDANTPVFRGKPTPPVSP